MPVLLLPVYFTVLENEKNNRISETAAHLAYASQELQNGLSEINSFLFNLKNNRDIVKLSFTGNDDPRRGEYLLNILQYMNQTFYPDRLEADIVLQFQKNDMLLTQKQIFDDKALFYREFFSYENMALDQWQQKIYGRHEPLWPSAPVSYQYHTASAFTLNHYFPSANNPSILASIIIPEQAVWSLLLTEDMRSSGFLYLTDGEDVVASYRMPDTPPRPGTGVRAERVDEQDYTVFTVANDYNGFTLVAGISESVYYQAVKPIRGIIITYTAAALLVALVLSLVFSYMHSFPLGSVVQYAQSLRAGGGVEEGQKNIYNYIKIAMADAAKSNQTLQRAFDLMKASYETRMFQDIVYGNELNEQDWHWMLERRPDLGRRLEESYAVMLLSTGKGEGAQADLPGQADLLSVVQEALDEPCLFQMENLCLILPVPPGKSAMEALPSFYERLGERLPGRVWAGMSSAHRGRDSLRAGYNEALHCLIQVHNAAVPALMCFDSIPPASNRSIIEMMDYYQLFNLLMIGDAQGLDRLLGEIGERLRRNPPSTPKQLEVVYYNIASVLTSVQERLLAQVPLDTGRFDPECFWEKELGGLAELARAQCEAVCRKKNQERPQPKEEILNYLEANFNQPQLCLSMVAEHFGISERYASQYIKEQTGKTYTQLIEELRMFEAQRLLRETDTPITDITQMVGFYNINTFYKSFKRTFSISPSQYKEIHRQRDAQG